MVTALVLILSNGLPVFAWPLDVADKNIFHNSAECERLFG
jgi:hypothetical protein